MLKFIITKRKAKERYMKMKTSKQSLIKAQVKIFLSDEKCHSVVEIGEYIIEQGIELDKNYSALRTALFSMMKTEVGLRNPEKGIYQYINVEQNYSSNENEFDENKEHSKHVRTNEDEYWIIQDSTRKNTKGVVSIMQNGDFVLNTTMKKCLEGKNIRIMLKKNGKEMKISLDENGEIKIGKNGKIKNYDMVNKIEMLKIKFPVYFVGSWTGNEWIGEYSKSNPNATSKKE